MGWGVAIAIVVAAVVAFVVYRMRRDRLGRRGSSRPFRQPVGPPRSSIGPQVGEALRHDRGLVRGVSIEPPQEGDGFGVLLSMVLGDRAKAERLVAYERTREPNASRSRWITSAIQRMRNDQR
jgi:hypothetical protein